MADECDSPYLASIVSNRRIAKPVLSFSRRLLINDENDITSPLVVRRVPRKRTDTSAMSPSVLGLANKKCRLTPGKKISTGNNNSSNVVLSPVINGSTETHEKQQQQQQAQQVQQQNSEENEKSPNKRKESEALIMKAVQLSEQEPDLIGDFSKPYALPVCSGKHSDLKTITPETLAALLRGEYNQTVDSHTIIDGRFPYEFEGGHIVGAINIYNKMALLNEFLDNKSKNVSKTNDENGAKHRHILVFHCEFSSERGPSLYRFLRNKDREINTSQYPQLFHPEIYILDGGYKAFFEKFKQLCTPQSYLPMNSKDHKEQMKQFRTKSKNLNQEASRFH